MDTSLKRGRGRPRAFNPSPEATTLQALDRAIVILKALARGDAMSLTEIAEASNQAAATAQRVLQVHARHGMVGFEAGSQPWAVGPEAFRIGSAFLTRANLVGRARGVMRDLTAAAGETSNLAIAAEGAFLSRVETHEPIRAFFRPGTRGPIHASGIGKALPAHAPAERVDRLLRGAGPAAFTARARPRPDARRDGGDPGAGLGHRRRGARRGHAPHRRAALQRVPRGGRGGVDLRPDGAGDPCAGGRVRGAGARGRRPDHPGGRRRRPMKRGL